MNVVASTPQLDSSETLVPGNLAVPPKEGLSGFDVLPFVSLLSWLTGDVLPAPKTALAPEKKASGNKQEPHDPQRTIAIELPLPAPPLKIPVLLDKGYVESQSAKSISAPVQEQQDTPPVTPSSNVAFNATLVDRTKESPIPEGAPVISPATPKEVPPEPAKSTRTEVLPTSVVPVEIASPKTQSTAPDPGRPSAVPPTSELKTEINTPIRPPPTREISLRLSGAESGSVDVRISERAGKVQVEVRTPDPELARSLRADLGDLVGKLDKRGFDAATSTPQTHVAGAVGSPERPHNQPDAEPRQSPGYGQQPSNERRGRPRQGRGRPFADVISERNEENHVHSN